MTATKAQVDAMLASIPDINQRKKMADILRGKIVKNVKCLSEECKGRLIGYVYRDGSIKLCEPDKEGKYWLRAHRHRLDGYVGFECWCGNDSRLAKQEVGHVGISVSKEAMESVAQAVDAEPSHYPIVNGEQIIDGFLLEDIG